MTQKDDPFAPVNKRGATVNGRGGKRVGAGRPLGSKNKVTLLKEIATAGGRSPLRILLDAAEYYSGKANAAMEDGNESACDKYIGLAADAAYKAAPYCHPKLASTTMNMTQQAAPVSVEGARAKLAKLLESRPDLPQRLADMTERTN